MRIKEKESLELSIIMPCLNEEKSVRSCVNDAHSFLKKYGINGEIIIVDNGCTDNSAKVALSCGARVVKEKRSGYGIALRHGIYSSRGRYLIMGDCDTTYDFKEIYPLYSTLKTGADMVIGNRFATDMERDAMSVSHRIGVHTLSYLGRLRFGTDVRDFHCGLRGMSRSAAMNINCRSTGMEFATEMIAEGSRCGLNISEVPVTLHRASVDRTSHLRAVRDGLRHLNYIISR